MGMESNQKYQGEHGSLGPTEAGLSILRGPIWEEGIMIGLLKI